MIYVASITTPSNTAKSEPQREKLKIVRGLLYRFELYFPPGSAGLVGVNVAAGGHQLYPTTLGEWFFGDNITIGFDETALLNFKTNYLYIFSYNEDTEYDHKVQLRLGVISDSDLIKRYVPGDSGDNTVKALTELTKTIKELKGNRLREGNPGLFGLQLTREE